MATEKQLKIEAELNEYLDQSKYDAAIHARDVWNILERLWDELANHKCND